MRVYPGRNPEKDLLFFLLRGRFSVDCEEFLRIVNDKVSDIFAYCVTDILVCLAVAMKEDLPDMTTLIICLKEAAFPA